MIPASQQNRTLDLYRLFSCAPYVPAEYWTTNRDFIIDPLYQHTAPKFQSDLKPPVLNFVLDTSLVPPPGNDPGSTDFQSAA